MSVLGMRMGTGTGTHVRTQPTYRSPLEEDILVRLDQDLLQLRQLAGIRPNMRIDTSNPTAIRQYSMQMQTMWDWWARLRRNGWGRRECAQDLQRFYAKFDSNARLLIEQSHSILLKQGQFSVTLIVRMLEFVKQLVGSTQGLRNLLATWESDPINHDQSVATSTMKQLIETVVPTTIQEMRIFFQRSHIDTTQLDEFIANNHCHDVNYAFTDDAAPISATPSEAGDHTITPVPPLAVKK